VGSAAAQALVFQGGMRGQPLHGFDENQIWCELVVMTCELTAWMQMPSLDGPAHTWKSKRLRLRLFTAAGRIVRGGRRLRLRLAASWPWATQITAAITRPQALAPADQPEPRPTNRERRPGGPWNPPTGATAGSPATASC
jgi:hypothetical protein